MIVETKNLKGIPKSMLYETHYRGGSGAEIIFRYHQPHSVACLVETAEGETAVGVALCSALDEFDPKIGKKIALGRALSALFHQTCTHPIRIAGAPRTWTGARARNLEKQRLIWSGYKAHYNNPTVWEDLQYV